MEREHDEEKVAYVIPSRTITGSVPQLLEEIDDMMEALQTVREAVVKRAPKPARPATNRRCGAPSSAADCSHRLPCLAPECPGG